MPKPVPITTYLACPKEVHDEMRSDLRRMRTETVPVGAQTYNGELLFYLRNCKICRSTLAADVDVDALPLTNDAAGHTCEETPAVVEELTSTVLDVAVTQI